MLNDDVLMKWCDLQMDLMKFLAVLTVALIFQGSLYHYYHYLMMSNQHPHMDCIVVGIADWLNVVDIHKVVPVVDIHKVVLVVDLQAGTQEVALVLVLLVE